MELIDTHAHLTDDKFDSDLDAVLERAQVAGVTRIIVCGYDLSSSEKAVRMSGDHTGIFATVGTHPHDASAYDPTTEARYGQLAADPKVVAIGEIGLDYHYDFSPRPAQRAAFEAQLVLAERLKLPVIIHSREAMEDTLCILRPFAGRIVGGVLHCFSGDAGEAAEVLGLGLYIGVDGPVTFKSNSKLAEVVRDCPIERLLVETDCPYMAPHPYRGKRNEPAYVAKVAEEIAKIRGTSIQEVAESTTAAACNLFRLPRL